MSSGAVYIVYGGAVINCKIFNNNAVQPSTTTATARGAGILVSNAFHASNKMRNDVKIVSNLIYNNTAKESSGIFIAYAQTGSATDKITYITNNTIVNNNATVENKGTIAFALTNLTTGGVNTTADKILISNNIIWGNKFNGILSSQINETELAKTTCTFNAIEGTIPGSISASNISLSAANETDVMFVLPTNETGYEASKTLTMSSAKWEISTSSACINAGNNNAYNATGVDMFDFAGSMRIQNSTIDIGAFEIESTTTLLKNTSQRFTTITYVEGGIKVSKTEQFYIFDVMGKLVWNGATDNTTIQLSKGLYLIKVVNRDSSETNKIMVR